MSTQEEVFNWLISNGLSRISRQGSLNKLARVPDDSTFIVTQTTLQLDCSFQRYPLRVIDPQDNHGFFDATEPIILATVTSPVQVNPIPDAECQTRTASAYLLISPAYIPTSGASDSSPIAETKGTLRLEASADAKFYQRCSIPQTTRSSISTRCPRPFGYHHRTCEYEIPTTPAVPPSQNASGEISLAHIPTPPRAREMDDRMLALGKTQFASRQRHGFHPLLSDSRRIPLC